MGKASLFSFTGASPEDMRSLAFIGDAVCHLYIRQKLCIGGTVRGLTAQAAACASATGQARAAEAITALLQPDEADVFRRGRNAKCGVVPRRTDPLDYRKATGFESLMGWLYLQDRTERLQQLLDAAFTSPSDNNVPGEHDIHDMNK
jgi:ribonuclease III family protein